MVGLTQDFSRSGPVSIVSLNLRRRDCHCGRMPALLSGPAEAPTTRAAARALPQRPVASRAHSRGRPFPSGPRRRAGESCCRFLGAVEFRPEVQPHGPSGRQCPACITRILSSLNTPATPYMSTDDEYPETFFCGLSPLDLVSLVPVPLVTR